MKRALAITMALSLVVGAHAMPAMAKKKKKKAAPVPVTFYMHGAETVGEVEAQNAGSGVFMNMDAEKPGSGVPKSMFVTNYLVGPNTSCSGNSLLPTWRGRLAGTVTGDVTLKLHTIGSPAAVIQAELFPDGTGGCDSTFGNTGYVPPVAAVQTDVPPGPGVTEITFPNVNFQAVGSLVVMLSIPGQPTNPYEVRVLYDDAAYDTSMSLRCTPATGTSCTS